jgi:GntR family transcriptional regulator
MASRTPVRQALATLANEGLIETATSRGTFVREQRPLSLWATRYERDHREVTAVDAYHSELEAQGRAAGQTLEMRIVPATAAVASRLRVPEDSLVVLRRCVRTVDGQPSSIQDSYYPYDIAEGTEIVSPGDVERGTIRVLAQHGHVEVGYVDEIVPRMPPTAEETRVLQLGPGVPVLDQIRTAYTTERPVRLTWNIWSGNGIHLMYEIGNLSAISRESDDEN